MRPSCASSTPIGATTAAIRPSPPSWRAITVEESFAKDEIEDSLALYLRIRRELGREHKSICLMDMATIGARYLRKKGLLDDLEVSDENNACSVYVDVDVDGATEKWLLQFKNETHNHPTEIEPFGGASTCLGGAIRDPLSGRSYVYQAMRVTGAAISTRRCPIRSKASSRRASFRRRPPRATPVTAIRSGWQRPMCARFTTTTMWPSASKSVPWSVP